MRNIAQKIQNQIDKDNVNIPIALTTQQLAEIANQIPPPSSIPAENIVSTINLRLVTDSQISEWNGKEPALGFVPAAASSVNSLSDALSYKEPANINIQAHVTSSHAPSNAQKNSDITKQEIEDVLTGPITSHSHAGGSTPTSWGKYF